MKEKVDLVMRMAYEYARRKRWWDEDAPGDFVLYISRAALSLSAKWQDRGIPFEHGVAVMLMWQMKSFAAHRAQKKHDARSAETAFATDCPIRADDEEPVPVPETPAMRRALYFAALGCQSLNEEHLVEIAGAAGVNRNAALSAKDSLCAKERVTILRARRDRAHSKMLAAQWKLREEVDLGRKSALREEERTARKRAEAARAMLANARRITHKGIACAACVPKGTVDSAIWHLQRRA